ncbi:hypothetical protein [Parafrankia sp. FMc2]|uniref:hypothetical protein n=1 Tax=Parafrankia sp. FMc2 TaxID=3233196 RepID=UPI0034D536E6
MSARRTPLSGWDLISSLGLFGVMVALGASDLGPETRVPLLRLVALVEQGTARLGGPAGVARRELAAMAHEEAWAQWRAADKTGMTSAAKNRKLGAMCRVSDRYWGSNGRGTVSRYDQIHTHALVLASTSIRQAVA